jgi:hypothetical protein
MQSGPHVTYGWGNACPDEIVSDMILRDQMPAQQVQLCDWGAMVEGYVPLTLTNPADQADPLAIARGVEVELLEYPEMINWDAIDPISIGCDYGGVMGQFETDYGYEYSFTDCQLWPGVTVNGKGEEIWGDDGMENLTLRLNIKGHASGDVVYVSDVVADSWAISGMWDGKAIETPRPMP